LLRLLSVQLLLLLLLLLLLRWCSGRAQTSIISVSLPQVTCLNQQSRWPERRAVESE
jgi:hypothetical protein